MMIEEIVQSIFDKWDCVDNVTEFTLELLTNNFDNLNKVNFIAVVTIAINSLGCISMFMLL